VADSANRYNIARGEAMDAEIAEAQADLEDLDHRRINPDVVIMSAAHGG
jgi:hypothetical protein